MTRAGLTVWLSESANMALPTVRTIAIARVNAAMPDTGAGWRRTTG
ncbi:hypothetical protein X011_08665 [Mycobacterium tuberculosis variant microti OV254]|nr:hypothetical protein X011_08665 [Mycobacterium tuberculosis variant microti OV254]